VLLPSHEPFQHPLLLLLFVLFALFALSRNRWQKRLISIRDVTIPLHP
jgi:hypothetical protein